MKIEHNSQMEIYRSPFGAVTSKSRVRLRLGISDGGIPQSVRVHYQFKDEKYFSNMAYVFEIGGMCMYEAELIMPDRVGLLWYYFEVINNFGHIYYTNNAQNLGGLGRCCNEVPQNAYQITVYSKDFKTPEWFKNSIVYQIFPDRFYNADKSGEILGNRNDIIKRNWGETPFYKPEQFGGEYLANDFFGGNLEGILEKLTYLAELGVGAIYLNPIFRAYSNHKYDTGNYKEIEPTLGTKEDFEKLCKKAQELGIRIILDGVFNHTGSNSLYFNKDGQYDSIGAYQSKDSEYFDWYNFTNYPNEYESWWGIKTLPGVNEQSESFRDYILRDEDAVVKHWLREGASGWRLDVVDELPGFFVKELRKNVKSVNDDAVIIGEVWEDASNKTSYGEQREYFLGYELDSVMNYPLRSALIDLAKNRIDAVEFDRCIMSIKENYPKPAYYSLLNFLSSHDVERILTAVSDAPDKNSVNKDFMANYKLCGELKETALKRVSQLVIMQMLLPGVPCIFYGDEIGLEGYGDPFCRGCMEWEKQNEDLKLWYKMAAALRKTSDAYTKGEFETVYKLDYGYAFIRMLDEDKHIVCANFGKNSQWFRLDIARYNIHILENEIFEEYYNSEDGIYYVEIPAGEVKVFCGRR